MAAMPALAADGAEAARCPKGTYAGPTPGKTSYRKDLFVWAVSSRFAADYCMPDDFVDTSLPDGIEAVAYRLALDHDLQVCTLSSAGERCSTPGEHVFELYVRHNAIEHAREGRFLDGISAPSKGMIVERLGSFQKRLKEGQIPPGAAGVQVFDLAQFQLTTVVEGKTDVRFGGLFVRTFYEGMLDGIDYLALEGQRGFTKRPLWAERASRQPLYILVERAGRPENVSGFSAQALAPRDVSTYAFALRIPKRIEAALIAADEK
jgi:hypothetical protein